MRYWKKLPLILRAIFIGFVVSTIGVVSWPLIGTLVPMPWAFITMALFLGLYIAYFAGAWKPESTQLFRKQRFRSVTLPKSAWILAIAGIVLIVLIEQSVLVVTFRYMEFPAELFLAEYSFLNAVPAWMGWLIVIMISAVAGICEEIGFRGYMQVPIEGRYGPVMAISVVSIIFVLVHLHQAWSGPILFHIFFISVLFGSIAYCANSLVPGIIAHFLMDVCNFAFWWSNLGIQFNMKTISETGVDGHFVLWVVILAISIGLFVFVVLKMRTATYNEQS